MQGEILKFAIKRSGLKVEEAADKLDMARGTLQSYFTKAKLDTTFIIKLKDVLGIDWNEESGLFKMFVQPAKRYDYSHVEDDGGIKYLSNQDFADMLRKVDAKTDVILSALSVLLSESTSGQNADKELKKLQTMVNKLLKS